MKNYGGNYMGKVTWNDLHDAPAKELMKKYKLTERGLQQELTKHLYGATPKDRQDLYKTTYIKRK